MKKGWKFPAPTFFFALLPFALTGHFFKILDNQNLC